MPERASPVPGIEQEPVGAWLRAHLPGVAADATFSYARIGDGRSNLTFRVQDDAGGRWVLRRPPLGERLRGAHDMAREHRLLAALHPAGVRVPRPLGLCQDEAVTGAPFYVMELADGAVVTDRSDLGALPAAHRATTSRSLAEELAALHAVDVDAIGLGDLARRDDYAARQVRGWWRQWEASRTRDVPAVDRLRDRLAAAAPAQDRLALVHGDYKLENVVLHGDGTVQAILDWELCTLGEPLADLGTMLAYWSRPDDDPAWALSGEDAPTRAEGFLDREALVAAYAAASGADLTRLPYYEALAAWRLAIIVQGVVQRFRDNPANANVPPEELDPKIDALAARGEALLDAA